LAEAETLLFQAVAADPTDVPALTCPGVVLCDEGKYQQAIEVLSRAEALGSMDRNTFHALAVATMNTSTHEEAMQIFARAAVLEAPDGTWEAYYDPQAQ